MTGPIIRPSIGSAHTTNMQTNKKKLNSINNSNRTQNVSHIINTSNKIFTNNEIYSDF